MNFVSWRIGLKQAATAMLLGVALIFLASNFYCSGPRLVHAASTASAEFERKYNAFVGEMNTLATQLHYDVADVKQFAKCEKYWDTMTHDPGWRRTTVQDKKRKKP